MGGEARGAELLAAWSGRGAVDIYGDAPGILLMPWLEGPSLGDVARAGRDAEATARLAKVAQRLHTGDAPEVARLPSLDEWFTRLLTLSPPPQWPQFGRRAVARATVLAKQLLASQRDITPLHGDLHHDNVRVGPSGDTVYDAKGILGERTFELTNAFRNPSGAPALLRDPDRARACTDVYAAALSVDRHRLMQWAAAKCALSIAWRTKLDRVEAEFDLLEMLLDLAESPDPGASGA